MIYHRDRICVDRLLKNHAIPQADIDKYIANFNDPDADPEDPDMGEEPEWGGFDDSTPEVPPVPTPKPPKPPKPPVDSDGEDSDDMYWEEFEKEEVDDDMYWGDFDEE
jgi:hypothetical protein